MDDSCSTGFSHYSERHRRRLIRKAATDMLAKVTDDTMAALAQPPIQHSLVASEQSEQQHISTADVTITCITQNIVAALSPTHCPQKNVTHGEEIHEEQHMQNTNVESNVEIQQTAHEQLIDSEDNLFRDDYYYGDSEDDSCEEQENEHTVQQGVDENMAAVNNFLQKYKKDYYDHEKNATQLLLNGISRGLHHIIAFWHNDMSVQHSKTQELLKLIREEIPVLSLPVDIRTVVKTPRQTAALIPIGGGDYCHFGLHKCLERIVYQRQRVGNTSYDIDLIISIDGAPIGKSSVKAIWPILCSAKDCSDVYIIGIYCGTGKPTSANEYLQMFVDEATEYVNNTFRYELLVYRVSIYALIFDAPAKAFLLHIKGHSGYDSCTKCEIEGDYIHRNLCFPGKIGPLRTDEKFRRFEYNESGYQKSHTILNNIPKLGLVSNVPLDPMHLVYLGVVRKLLFIWLFAPLQCKLRHCLQQDISDRLLAFQPYVPYEFARKPRSLSYVKLFKATEFRQLVLYTGVLAFKDIVTEQVYTNFTVLHVVLTILNSPLLFKKADFVSYAEQLLVTFVKTFEKLYGPSYVTYNIHNLYHLVQDCRKYGTLDKFSAFKFENFLARIKNMLRKGHQTLQQLQRRFEELEAMSIIKSTMDTKDILVTHPHNKAIDRVTFNVQYQYAFLKHPSYTININDDKNNCVLIDNTIVVEVTDIVTDCDNKIHVIGKRLVKKGDLYTVPISSSRLGIYIVNSQDAQLEKWSICRISAKLFKLPYKSDFVTFPILHTYT